MYSEIGGSFYVVYLNHKRSELCIFYIPLDSAKLGNISIRNNFVETVCCCCCCSLSNYARCMPQIQFLSLVVKKIFSDLCHFAAISQVIFLWNIIPASGSGIVSYAEGNSQIFVESSSFDPLLLMNICRLFARYKSCWPRCSFLWNSRGNLIAEMFCRNTKQEVRINFGPAFRRRVCVLMFSHRIPPLSFFLCNNGSWLGSGDLPAMGRESPAFYLRAG